MVEILLILLSAVPGAVEAPSPPLPWHNPAQWQRLAAGQTPDQVRQRLGEPLAEEASATRLLWFYQAAPTVDAAGRTVRPTRGLVIFARTADGWAVQRAAEPVWGDVEDWEQQQERYRQAVADQRRLQAAEPAAPTLRPVPRPSAADRPSAPIVYRPATERPAASIPPATPDARLQLHTRYWLTAAGVFIGMAFLFALAQGCKFFR